MPKKIFISQPMRDKTKEKILAERNKAIELVNAKYGEDAEIIDSYFEDFEDATNIKERRMESWLEPWFLGTALNAYIEQS